MNIGFYLRNMGPSSDRALLAAATQHAEAANLDAVWVADHIAIPPDDAEGSEGRYLDPLATLAYLAGCTEKIGLGTSVLVLPYRPALATAKWIATIHELSGERLLLGIGAGWMEAEFRATGTRRSERGKVTDATLRFLHECFSQEIVEANGQDFIFRPRPSRPKIYVGGSGPRAFRRTVEFGEGWMPIGTDPKKLALKSAGLRKLAHDAGKPDPEIELVTTLPLQDPARAEATARTLAEGGATGVVHAQKYIDEREAREAIEALGLLREKLADSPD
jgi:probable F420-dependent oxidoreductase